MTTTKQDLMEMSNESLGALMIQIRAECDRRKISLEVIALHPGNSAQGKPTPALVRVLSKIPKIAPGDVAKVETLIDGLLARDAPARDPL